jgi:hypothetical protein
MPATTRRNYTVTPATDRQIADLAAWWGGVAELPAAQVIREAVRRAWEAEARIRRPETRTRTRNRSKKGQ